MTAEEIRKQVHNGTYQYKTNTSAYNNSKTVENTANVNSKLSAEQIRKNVRDGKYNFDFSTVDRDVEEAKQRLFPNRATQADVLAAEEKTNSQRAAEQRVKNETADTNSINEEMSYDEKNKALRNQEWKAYGKRFLTGLGYIASDENSKDAMYREYQNAKQQHKDIKAQHDELKQNKWNETQEYNSKILSDDEELVDLVKKAYSAKAQYDLSQETMSALPSYNNMNSAVNGIPSLADYKNAGSTTNEYEKALKAVTDKGYTAEEAKSLIDTYSRQINAQKQAERTEKTEQFANEHPVLASGAYVASNIGQLAGTKELIQNGVANGVSDLFGGEYKPLDTNTYGFAATNFRDTISETVSENIRNDVAEKTDSQLASNTAAFLYQVGLSIGDFASLSGLGQPASLAIMGTSAAMSTAKDATERGASADDAMLSALWAGATEIVFERLSLENLDALKATGRSGVKNIVKDILKQSFTEGSEEVFTDIANAIGDQIINGDNAQLSQQYEELISNGLSEEDAWKQVAADFAKQLGQSYLGGAISGGVMGTGAVAYGNIKADSNYRAIGNEIKNSGDAQAQINAGLAKENTSKAYKAAQALQNKFENGISYDNDMKPIDYSSFSSRKLGRLAQYNAQEDAKLLNDSAKVFEGDTAKSYVYAYGDNGYKGNVYDYNTGFNAVYMAQQQGKSIEEAYDMALDKGSHITPIQAKIAYDAAQNDGATAEFKNVLSQPVKIGATVVAKSLDNEQQKTVDFVNEMAKTAGVEVVIPARMQDVGLKDANGAYVNGKIVLPLDNQGRMMNVYLGHEMFHHFKKNVPDNANVLQNYVIEKLKADASYNYEQRLDEVINDYGFKGTREQQIALAHEEMAANACFTVFAEEQNVKQFVKQDATLAQRVHDFFVDLIGRMKKALEGLSKRNKEYNALSKDIEAKEQIVSMFNDCLKESQKNNTTTSDSAIKYSFKDIVGIGKVDRENIKYKGGFVIESESDLKAIIEKSLENKQIKENYYLGNIKSGVKEKITNDLGIDIFKNGDYSFLISSDDIRHISKHFQNADDIANSVYRLYDVINNYDTVSIDETEKQKYNKNKLIFNKHYNDFDYRSVEIVSKKNRTFDLVSFFITKNNKKRNKGNGLANTSKVGELASQTVSVSNNNVPQSETSVNSNDMQDKAKYSLKEDSEGNPLSDEQIKRYKNIAPELRDEQGRIKPFYHGTSRADRVGNYFNPDRATSGPMAYFTDNEKIADNYSKNKSDTSLAYDDEYDSYETQFRVDDKSITEYWYTLSPSEKRELTQKIQQVTLDDDDNIVLKSDNKYEIGNFNDYELNMARGNALQVLVDGWLNGGTLWGDEYRFVDVLNAIGIKNAEYKNPDYREEKVYKVYLNITNPFNTDNVDEEFVSDLEDYVEATDMSVYDAENAQADMWDKNSIDIYDWIERLKDDFANGTTHAWTSIPDVVTDFLKEYGGYNGIIDRGGKQGGEIHTVAIPFYSNQIKNVDNLNPTDNEDIRYSKKESINVDDFSEEEYNYPKLGKKEYKRLYSEIMRWHANHINQITKQNLDNGYKYVCILDDEYNLTVLGKYKSINIHERYKNDDGTRNRIAKRAEISGRNRGHSGNSVFSTANTKTAGNNAELFGTDLQQKRQSNRRGNAENDNYDYSREEKDRYSLKEQPIDFNAILEENAELSEMNEDLQQMLKLTSEQNEKLKNEFKITDRHNISNNAVDKVAAALRKQYASSYDKSSLVSNLAGLYDYIANAGSNIDSGYIWQKANDIAKNIIANSQQKDTVVYDEYKELRDRIRNTEIRVPQTVQDNFADYNAFRRENFGRMRLSDSGIELDVFYNELSAECPEFFDVDVSEEQQLEALANFFEVTAPVYYNSAKQNAESMGLNMEQYANLIAGDIFDKYFDVPEVMTAAEKHKKEIDSLKLHYRNQIADMRQAYKNRYDERLREVKAENAKRVTKLRADKADALAKQKAHFEDVSQRGKDRRKKSQLRASIRKQLNKVLNLANKPTKDKHIPIPIIESVRELCNAINLSDTQGDTRIKEKVLNFQSALDAVSSGRYFDNLDNADKAKILMNKKIAVGMTDSERYSILKGKKIYNVPVATNVDEYGNTIIENWNDINIKVGREKQNLINRIATQFGAFKKYSNSDIELDFEFTKNNFRESYNKQGKNFDDFAKMFSVFDRIVHNAVGIEIHNRNKEGYKVDLTLENVYVLVSAFQDGDSIVPVKLEIKQFSDKPNKLYVAVTSDKIKMTEVWKQGNTINGVTQGSRSVNISIFDLFKKINPEHQNLYKYIPSHFKDGYEDHTDFSQLKSRYANMYNELMQARVEQFISEVGDKTINELSVNDLTSIDELLKITITQINNINRLFKKEQNVRIEDYAAKVSDELSQFKKSAIRDGMTRSLMYNSMKPEYFFQYLGSNTLLELYHDLRKGEDIWAVDIADARAYALEIRKKYGWQKWDNKSKQSFNTDYGTIELTLQERLAIYANSIGEHTKNHMLGGGFVYHKAKQKGIQKLKKQRNDSGNHRLSESDVENIVASLDESQKAYVRDMISYLSDVMGVKGNEVTKVLYGIELFKEKMYYPAKIDKKSRHNSSKEFKADKKIKNAGFTNSALPNAPQPVELMDFDDVWASHVDEMSKYHAFVLPLENMDRVYNNYQKNSDNKYSSVKEMLEDAYGAKAITYIDDLIGDINGGVVHEAGTDFISRATSLFKKNAVFASASVAIQQPSAIGRALSEVDAKYFAKTTFSGFNRKAYDEMKKYAPIAVIKEMGYFDTNMAQSTVDFLNNNDYEGIKEKVKAFVKDGSYRDEALSFFASRADEITWTHIWNACKAEIKAENSTLTQEQILEKAGERFTDVISKTQVYDSVFSRSGLMRSRDSAVKNATAFMAEPTTSLNMLVNAVVQAKRGKMSKAQGARVLGSLVAASVINSLLQSIVTAARADDDDKDWAEVYLAQLIPNFIDNLNPFNQIVFLKDIINIFQGYDVTRADMNLISDLYNAIDRLDSDKVSTYKKITGLSGAIAAFFGLPVKNVIRDVESAFNVGKDFFDDKKFSSDSAYDLFKEEMNNMFGFALFNADLDIALKAVSKGDIDTYNAYADEIYATDDAYDLLYGVLVKYGYNSSQYRTAEKKCIDIKKENGAKNPNPNTSMKNRAIKDYADAKVNGTYKEAEPLRQLCIQLYGDMTKVNEALEKLNN